MPVKFKESSSIRSKTSGKVTQQHYYMHAQSTQTLLDFLAGGGMPKIKQKVRRELVKRGVDPVIGA